MTPHQTDTSMLLSSGASHASPIIHVTVGTSDWSVVLAGFVGGVTILVGVAAAEALGRFRERRRRLDEVMWSMDEAVSGLLGGSPNITGEELRRKLSLFTSHLARIRSLARWPVRNSREINRELNAVYLRFALAVSQFRIDGVPPQLGPVIGLDLNRLVMGGRKTLQGYIDDGLRAAGYPTLDEWDDNNAWPTRAGGQD